MKDGDVPFTFLDSEVKRDWFPSILASIKKCTPRILISAFIFFFQEELMGNLGSFRHFNFFKPFFAFYFSTFQET